MARLEIRDDALWVKHIHDGQEIRSRIDRLHEGEAIGLIVDGRPLLFRKMRVGHDGRATAGVVPDAAYRDIWAEFQTRRGEIVSLAIMSGTPPVDPELSSLDRLLEEWYSPEDAAAYDDL